MRKSELGNLVAANMAGIMDSDEHRSLFHKQAKFESEEDKDKPDEKKDDEDNASADTCKCSDACPCNDGGECNECAVTAKLNGLFEGILKMSETLDELGLSKSASNMIKAADELLAEAAGADTVEEMLRENPDLDVDLAVVKERPEPETEGEFDPRLMGLELAEEMEGVEPGAEDIVAQLEAIENVGSEDPLVEAREGSGLEEPEWLKEELEPGGPERGVGLAELPELEAAHAEVDAWLKKHNFKKSEEIKLDADLSSLLTTAEKEVEDYLIEKNMSFEDEA